MRLYLCTFIFSLFSHQNYSQDSDQNFEKLKKAYPDFIKNSSGNKLILYDNSLLTFDDGKSKNEKELIENADIEDMFKFSYVNYKNIKKTDAGRIRNNAFFKKMYGSSKKEVEKNLVEIIWCPKLVNQKIKITTVNNVADKIRKISEELDQHSELTKYLTNIGGTFNWRNIAGTNRLSMHSFGMTIDINVSYADYWQWQCKCTDESKEILYRNRIPEIIVAIFEKYGFIWGGNWAHFDTMHFEYRPELLIDSGKN